MGMEKWFVMLIGLPASGKSSFTETFLEAAGKKNCFIISSDAYIERWAAEQGTTYSIIFNDVAKEAEKQIWQDFESAIANGIPNIIWDQTNVSAKSRKIKLSKVPEDYKKWAIVFDIPETNLHKKLLASRPGKTIPDFVIESMKKNFQYPEMNEGFDRILYRKLVEEDGKVIQKHSEFKWSN